MKNRKTQSALLMAGAAAGAVAVTLIGKRRLRAVTPEPHVHQLVEPEPERPERDEPKLVEPESAELPLGVSADPDIDHSLSRAHLPQNATSGAALLGDLEARPELDAGEASLDEIWSSTPGLVGGEQSEGYDAVQPEDLGAVWLERATQTTHDERPHASDPNEMPFLDALTMSEGSRLSARALDDDEIEDERIAEDALDAPPESGSRSGS